MHARIQLDSKAFVALNGKRERDGDEKNKPLGEREVNTEKKLLVKEYAMISLNRVIRPARH